MELQLINTDPHDRAYNIKFNLSEVQMFIDWFSRVESRVSVKINGHLYRFKTEQEKAFFTYGLGHFYRETEFNTSRIEKLKTSIKNSNLKISGIIEHVKGAYQLLN